jgi:inorganic phosphate transporter, PiT family
MPAVSAGPYVLLGVALLIALGFEFVNGFHDTAYAVATVIYTHSLEPHVAVVWSGYAQGAAAEITAMATAMVPATPEESTCVVLPASICLSAILFWTFSRISR